MKRRFKLVFSVLCIVVLSLTLSVSAFAAEPSIVSDSGQTAISADIIVTPQATISYSKTVYRYYAYPGLIPNSIYYEEISEVYHSLFSGTLYYQGAVYQSGYWRATFTGDLFGQL